MTSNQLDRVERELGISLPANCRELVLTYPAWFGPHEGTPDDEQWPSLEAWLKERLQEEAE